MILINDPLNLNKIDNYLLYSNKIENIHINNILFYNKFYDNYDKNTSLTSEEHLEFYKSNIIDKQYRKKNINNYDIISNAILLQSITQRIIIQHFMFDFVNQLNYYYDDLIKNPVKKIIIEIINFKNDYFDENIVVKFCKYLNDINLLNKIYIISNNSNYYYNNQNNNLEIIENKIFVKNLELLYITNLNSNYLELLSRRIIDPIYETNFHEKLKSKILPNIIKNKNIQFEKKFLIVQEKIKTIKSRKVRGFTHIEWNNIINFSKCYCLNNNLELLIWNSDYTSKSIIEQQIICNNAEVIISIGGSFNLFNIGNTCSNIIIFEIQCQNNYDWNNINLMKKTKFLFNNYSFNTNLYMHFNEKNNGKMIEHQDKIIILDNILNKNISNYFKNKYLDDIININESNIENITIKNIKIGKSYKIYNKGENILQQRTFENLYNILCENITQNFKKDNIILQKSILFYNLTKLSEMKTHQIFDFIPFICYYYDYLINNSDINIIIEQFNVYNLKSVIFLLNYFRDIKLLNNIYVITDNKLYKFNNELIYLKNNIFCKKLQVLKLENIECSYLPLLFRSNFFSINNSSLKNVFKKYKFTKKYLIIEKRIDKKRGFKNEEEWNNVLDICNDYCKNNNLELYIWELIQESSLYEQHKICYNADIMISHGGSFNLFNITNTCRKILILNMDSEPFFEKKIIKNITYNIFLQHRSTNNLFYYYQNNNINNKYLIKDFLYYDNYLN